MTENDMLHLEKENYTTIHLHLVGIFWRAYQRSACGFPLYNSTPLWDRIYHKAWLSARRKCYSRIRVLKLQYPDKKFSFDELYNEICIERYLKSRGEL